MSELITYSDLKAAGIKNKVIEAVLGISNAANLAKSFSDKHQAKALELLNQYRDAAEFSAAPALLVKDEIDKSKVAQSETIALKGLAAVANLTSQVGLLCAAGLHLVAIAPDSSGNPTKGPVITGWNQARTANNQHGYSNNPDDFINCKEGYNIGLCHKPSGTAAFDIDDLKACLTLFDDVGLPMNDWLDDAQRVEIRSGKANRGKLLFRLPEGVDSFVTRQFSHDKVMLFELRNASKTGSTVQDVIAGTHPETGTNYQIIGDIANIPTIPDGLLDVALHWDDWRLCFESALGIVEPPKFAAPMKLKGEHLPGFINPITKFNETYTPEDILIRNGYRAVGKDRFIRPGSTSSAPGVVILRNCKDSKPRVYSFGADALNDGYGHDAIDIYRLLECAGAW